jgi:hypothetical protein
MPAALRAVEAVQISGLASLPLDIICMSNPQDDSVVTVGRPWTLRAPFSAVFLTRSDAARRTWELGNRSIQAPDPNS